MDKDFSKVLKNYTGMWHVYGILRPMLGVTVFLQQMEGLIYFFIFLHIYKHEKTIKPFLTEKSLKGRRRRNALTLMSQVYYYVIEQAFITCVYLIAINEIDPHLPTGTILLLLEFPIRCSVQAMASTETRQVLKTFLKNIKLTAGFEKQHHH